MDDKIREELINRMKYGLPYKPTRPLHEEFNFINLDHESDDEEYVKQKLRQREEEEKRENELIREALRGWAQRKKK